MSELFPDPELHRLAAARPENELLLLCARTRVGAEAASRAAELARAVEDWDYLYSLARRHAVLPLLQRGLEELLQDFAPQTLRERLRAKFRENATRNEIGR